MERNRGCNVVAPEKAMMELIESSFVSGNVRDFAEAIKVLITKPNVVNKRLVGAELLSSTIKAFNSEHSLDCCAKETTGLDEWLRKQLLGANVIRNSTIPPSKCIKSNSEVPDLASITQGSCEVLRKCVIKQRFQNNEHESSLSSKNRLENCFHETIIWQSYPSDFSATIIVHFVSHNSSDLCYAFVYESSVKSKDTYADEVIDEDITEFGGFGKIKLFVERKEDSIKTVPSINGDKQLRLTVDNSGWLQWLRSRCFKQLVKWCNEEIGSIGVVGTKQPSLR